MEPERKIEKLLRAFAKKRREQAPESMKLHSAMRQQLHREITRRADGKASGGFFAKLFPGGRPWLGFAVGIAAVIIVCGFFLLPMMNGPKTERLAAQNKEFKKAPIEVISPAAAPQPPTVATAPTVAVPSPLPEAAPAIAFNDKQKAVADDVPRHGNTKMEASDELAVPEMQRPAEVSKDVASETNFAMDVAAFSPPSSSSTATVALKTGNRVQALSGAGGAPLNSGALIASTPPATSSWTANAPASPATVAVNEKAMRDLAPETAPASVAADSATFYRLAQNETSAAQPPVSQHFHRLNLPANSPRAAKTNPAPILASFRVEQTGDRVRMVDADGSVYTGNVQAAPRAYGAVPAAGQNKPAAYAEDRSVSGSAAARSYFFRVAGTNRNLKQNIIFTGNFILLTNMVSRQTNAGGGRMVFTTRRAAEEPAASQTWLLNSRISGNVTIGDQRQIEVNAAPTTK